MGVRSRLYSPGRRLRASHYHLAARQEEGNGEQCLGGHRTQALIYAVCATLPDRIRW